MRNKKFVDAVNFIYHNIDKPLRLEEVAYEVGLSLSSLKRLFQEVTDQNAGAFIRRLRMELAFRSLQNRNDSVLEVALAAGFDDHSAFSRSFKETFGFSPVQARQKLNIINELEHISLEEPDVVELTNIALQSVTETGIYYISAANAWKKLQLKLKSSELCEDGAEIFIGLGHDNPHDGSVTEDKVRYSAGVAFHEKDLNIDRMTLTSGRYARFRYVGKPASLGLAYHYIFGKWLEKSSIKINQNLPTFQMFDGFPDPLKEERVMIHVPVLIS